MRVQRRRRGHDDEVHDRIRGEHAGRDVRTTRGQLLTRRAATLCQIAAQGAFFLHFLRRLPEEQVWRDRRTEDRDEHREEGARPAYPTDGHHGYAKVHMATGRDDAALPALLRCALEDIARASLLLGC